MSAPLTFNVSAEYQQFFLLDDELQPLYPEDVPQLAIDQRFQAIPNLVAVYTTRSDNVLVSVSVSEMEPQPDFASWSHIVVCPLAVPSGRVILAGCTDYLPECPRVQVPKGNCGVLISMRGLTEGEREEYWLQFWSGLTDTPRVLKNHAESHG